MLGRYYYYLLHPFSLAEVLGIKNTFKPLSELTFKSEKEGKKVLAGLLRLGGFPEPFLKQSQKFWRRWQAQRLDRLVREEIRDLTKISDLSRLQILVEILPNKVGSLLSINNLKEDLQVAHKTVVSDLNILERFYFHFRLYPFARTKIKSIRKMAKLYLWDWSTVDEEGGRVENLVVSHLLKLVHYWQNSQGYKTNLYYLRDLEGREVDFLITFNDKPWFAVEVKLADTNLSSHLLYFAKRLSIPYLYQTTTKEGVDFYQEGIRIISLDKFLTGLI